MADVPRGWPQADSGSELHALIADLFPITRSIAGPGFRASLDGLEAVSGPIARHRFATGEHVFDWTVPQEWELRRAWIKDPHGQIVVDSDESNLHVVSHSRAIHARMALDELELHLSSLPAQPDAIPYRTTYYADAWGFCLADRVRGALEPGEYEVLIDADLRDGHVELGEVIVPGESSQEVLFSTYCCHPSMANNELSGPAVVAWLARLMRERTPAPRLTYRFLFVPETIGTIAYLSRWGDELRERLIAGYVVTCVGTPFQFNYKRSRRGDTLADRAARHVLGHAGIPWVESDFYPGRSDERQYCSPGFDLAVGSLTRVDWDTWTEYHTSLDDLSHVTPEALGESVAVFARLIETLEANETFEVTMPYGEPQLGRRGLYPTLGGGWQSERHRAQLEAQMFLLNYCDGRPDLLAAAERRGLPVWELRDAAELLLEHGLLRRASFGAAEGLSG